MHQAPTFLNEETLLFTLSSRSVCQFSIHGRGLPYGASVEQPTIPAVYRTAALFSIILPTHTGNRISGSSRAKRCRQHYTGNRHYSNGTIGRPPLCHRQGVYGTRSCRRITDLTPGPQRLTGDEGEDGGGRHMNTRNPCKNGRSATAHNTILQIALRALPLHTRARHHTQLACKNEL